MLVGNKKLCLQLLCHRSLEASKDFVNWYVNEALMNFSYRTAFFSMACNEHMNWQVGPLNITEFKYRCNSDKAIVLYR